jgi:hypothetical protein
MVRTPNKTRAPARAVLIAELSIHRLFLSSNSSLHALSLPQIWAGLTALDRLRAQPPAALDA